MGRKKRKWGREYRVRLADSDIVVLKMALEVLLEDELRVDIRRRAELLLRKLDQVMELSFKASDRYLKSLHARDNRNAAPSRACPAHP